MTTPRSPVLRPGDWVAFDGEHQQVVGLTGVSVRLRSATGADSVVLASYLLASPSFEMIDSVQALPPELEPFGLLDGLPEDVLAPAREWQRHVVEVETGLAPDPPAGATPARSTTRRARPWGSATRRRPQSSGSGCAPWSGCVPAMPGRVCWGW